MTSPEKVRRPPGDDTTRGGRSAAAICPTVTLLDLLHIRNAGKPAVLRAIQAARETWLVDSEDSGNRHPDSASALFHI